MRKIALYSVWKMFLRSIFGKISLAIAGTILGIILGTSCQAVIVVKLLKFVIYCKDYGTESLFLVKRM